MWKHTGWVIRHNFSYKQWWNNDIYLCLKVWSGSKDIWCNALAGLMDQPVLDSNIKFIVSLTRAATATLRALLFQERITFVYMCLFHELSYCKAGAAVGLQAAPPSLSYKPYLSIRPYSWQPAFDCPSVSRLSSVVPLWSLCLSLALPGSALFYITTPACQHWVSGHASYLLSLTGLG